MPLQVGRKQKTVTIESVINPSPRQVQFMDTLKLHDFVLYGGAAGGGKSYILRWALVWTLLSISHVFKIKGCVAGLFCEDYPSLSDRQIGKIRAEFPPWLGTLKLASENRHFQIHEQYGGGIIALRNLDDPSKYQSSEFAAIAVDELTKNPVTTFDYLRLRLRWPGIEHPKFMAGTNPGGPGHAWVKAYWVDRKFPRELLPLAHQFALVPAKATDNPHLTQSYWDQLQTLPKAMREAFADGRWDIFAGQYFDVFDPTNNGRHVRPPHELGLQVWHPRWIGVDWGFAHPAAVYWNAMRDDGVLVTYREKVEANLSPVALAQKIIELSREMVMDGDKPTGRHESDLITHVYMGPDAWAKRTDADSVADQMNRVFRQEGFPLCTQASNDRIGGWTLMYDMLRDNKWIIGSNCTNLIECLPTLVRDEKKPEDVVKVNATSTMRGDDEADAVRYAILSRLRPQQPPIESRIAQRVKEMGPDQFARMMHLHRIEAEERAKTLHTGPGRSHWTTNRWSRLV